ncbi:MAG: hypothetical protein ACYDER_17680 [Ktedonobacteraceae bacterium]
MSQRMDYDEPGEQQQNPPFNNYQSGYRDPFAHSYGQKIPTGLSGSHAPSAGQRLALAIVSLCLLVPLISVIIPVSVGAGSFAFVGGLIAIGVICITIIAVNFVFNAMNR